MKILIVDDNFKIREMVRLFLQNETDEFQECEDGSEALASYAAFLPDWVLMDWEMREMDGLAATREILRFYPTAKILMFTQYTDAELRSAAREAGAFGFVLKDELFNLRRIMTAD